MTTTQTYTPARGEIIDYTFAGTTTRYYVTNKRGDNIWVQTIEDFEQKRKTSNAINIRFWGNIKEVK